MWSTSRTARGLSVNQFQLTLDFHSSLAFKGGWFREAAFTLRNRKGLSLETLLVSWRRHGAHRVSLPPIPRQERETSKEPLLEFDGAPCSSATCSPVSHSSLTVKGQEAGQRAHDRRGEGWPGKPPIPHSRFPRTKHGPATWKRELPMPEVVLNCLQEGFLWGSRQCHWDAGGMAQAAEVVWESQPDRRKITAHVERTSGTLESTPEETPRKKSTQNNSKDQRMPTSALPELIQEIPASYPHPSGTPTLAKPARVQGVGRMLRCWEDSHEVKTPSTSASGVSFRLECTWQREGKALTHNEVFHFAHYVELNILIMEMSLCDLHRTSGYLKIIIGNMSPIKDLTQGRGVARG